MPRGMHPNSLANLKKGKATQFGANGVQTAREAGRHSGESRRGISTFSEAMRGQMNGDNRQKLTSALIANMAKSPEWYKLGLRMLGELPPEQVDIRAAALSTEAQEQLDKLLDETRGDIR